MKYDFDEVIDRRNTGSLKHDFAVKNGMPEDVLPFWVADMDFKAPAPVIEALSRRVLHGIYGYGGTMQPYLDAVTGWYRKRFGWQVEEDWMVQTPGVVFAVAMAVRAFAKEGEGVMIQRPVYYPFGQAISDNSRKLVNSPLVYRDGRYTVDLCAMEEVIKEERPKLFILCSPHNPVGRVWTREELIGMGDLCVRYGITVVADEIHSDFVWPGHEHTVFASIKPEFAEIAITCTAPSKTFNLAGMQDSNIFIPNPKLRKAFQEEIDKTGFFEINVMGMAAAQAAYEAGSEWLEQLKEYLLGNIELVRETVRDRMPGVRLVEPEGTYLLWLDMSEVKKADGSKLSDEERQERIVKTGKLWFDTGKMFGPEGASFERINIASPRSVLKQGLDRLAAALSE